MSYLIFVFSAVEPSKLVRKVHPLIKEKKHAELFGFEAVYGAMKCNDSYSIWFQYFQDRVMKVTHKFSQFTYWNLETPTSNNDAIVKAMQWINIASAVSKT